MLRVGIVGVRGLSVLAGLRAQPDVEVTAFCDLDGELLAQKAKEHGITRTFRIYEDMLQSDVDAVVIATPMQCHVPQALLALTAGKHVLSEVTAGVTMDELWWLRDAVERSGRVYMMAENYNYTPELQQVNEMVRAGLFGDPYFAEGEYLHEIKWMNFQEDGTPTWRNYWQQGVRGCFYPTHSLGPCMQWFPGDHIDTVSCFGTGWHTAPEIRQEDTTLTLLRMKSGKLIKLRVDCVSNRPHCTYFSLQGTKGVYEAPRGLGDTHKVWFMGGGDERNPKWRPLSDFGEYLPERYKAASASQLGAGHGGGDFFIVKDFVDAVNGEKPPAVSVYDACEWTAVALLSALSAQNGGRAMKMPDFTARDFASQIISL